MIPIGDIKIYGHWVPDLKGSIVRFSGPVLLKAAKNEVNVDIITFLSSDEQKIILGGIQSVLDDSGEQFDRIIDHQNNICLSVAATTNDSFRIIVYIIRSYVHTDEILKFSTNVSRFHLSAQVAVMASKLDRNLSLSKVID